MTQKIIENPSPNWGGPNRGQGRKPSGKIAKKYYATPDEHEQLRAYLLKLRNPQ